MSRTMPRYSWMGVERFSGPLLDAVTASRSPDATRILSRSYQSGVPFADDAVSAGSETELQVVVVGEKSVVDLPRSIEASRYFSNLVKRSSAQDMPKRALRELTAYLESNRDGVWENSWVRLAPERLAPAATRLMDRDLRSSRSDPRSPRRSDVHRFLVASESGATQLRLPVSYVMNLALSDYLARDAALPRSMLGWCSGLQRCLINDNVSPETCSFYVSTLASGADGGRTLARETAERFLLTHLLVAYANRQFGLADSGQRASVHFSPHTPLRQQRLNECISDTFYRELFISPCLSGWDRGEEKHAYMRLCHEVLSRSQLHAAAKVRDAGLIVSNLLMLPSFSSTSLSNNGTHVSLGSRRLEQIAESQGPVEEKRLGDLVTKIVEHFVPLFIGTYSAAPWRIPFTDFHAEKVLGFLPHELDFTHLRMLWRRWKQKAAVKLFGQPLSPTGYATIDRLMARVFRLRGDFIADNRLLDYLVAPLSTSESPALDGTLGNVERLKHDLAMAGIYDEQLSFYALYRQRMIGKAGYAGFEARYYSLCSSLMEDLGPAVDLQRFVTAWAFQRVLSGEITHEDIPDDPITESERRQTVFGAAIGIPTFFVGTNTSNRLLRTLIADAAGTRSSSRYPGYVRIKHQEYQLSLLRALTRDQNLVKQLFMAEAFDDLEARLRNRERYSASGKLTRGILDSLGARDAMKVPADDFNQAAERFYREDLRRAYLQEAIQSIYEAGEGKQIGESILRRSLTDEASLPELMHVIRNVLGAIHRRACQFAADPVAQEVDA